MTHLASIDLPAREERTVSVRVTGAAAARCRGGHPWVFDGDVTRVGRDAPPGTIATLYDPSNKLVAIGLFDPGSPIRVRVVGAAGTRLDRQEIAARVAAAAELRSGLVRAPDTTGYRLLHGPNDGLPGVVADVYEGTLVLKLYSAAWLPWLRRLVEAIGESHPWERLVVRLARAVGAAYGAVGISDGDVVDGPPLDGPVLFRENGLVFEAEPVVGQKTGFFLDQRENRARVGELSAGRRVLNVFSYTGGFSLYAARGGAREVVSVDVSRPAIAAAERNFAHNLDVPTVAACRHRGMARDAFEAMDELRDGEPFDLVVIDPPSFAKRASERDRALRAYARLAEAGLRLLAPGGTVALASCSSRVTLDAFADNAHAAARRAGRPFREFARTEHPVDHPVAFPEARYLKCVYARA